MSLLGSLFGPSKEEVWAQVAQDIGGDFESGGFWQGSVLRYQHGPWELLLDTYATTNHSTSNEHDTQTFTRMRAPFVNQSRFRFEIYRAGLFSLMASWLGAQDIVIGDRFFDDDYVIRGNHEEQVRNLLASEELRRLIRVQPNIHFKVIDYEGFFFKKYPANVDALYFETYGVITEFRLVKNLFEMFTLTLDRLVKIGSAADRDPGVNL